MNFFNRYKKLFLVIGFLGVTLILAFLIFTVFFKPAVAPIPPENISTTTLNTGFPSAKIGEGQTFTPGSQTELPFEEPTEASKTNANQIAQGGLTKTTEISNAKGLGTTLSGNGSDIQYYNKNDGKFYSLNKDGEAELLSEKVFHNVQNVAWAPNKNKAILEYPDGANILYNFQTKTQISLPAHWKEFNFSPDSNNIVMKIMANDEKNRWLAISNDDGSKVKPIEHLGAMDSTVYPSWSPNNQVVAVFTEGSSFDQQEVYFVGKNNENFKSTTIEGRGFQPQWSPEGNKLLYSVYSSKNDLKPELWIVNAEGNSIGSGRKRLNLETWADKCTFTDSSNLYCAVPENLEPGSGLFPEMANNSTDRLFKIDPQTGLKKLIAIPDNDASMSNLFISENGYYLYFTDNKTGHLNKIKLK